MILIYIIKITDEHLYIYNRKKRELFTENIAKQIIKDNKIYHVQKAMMLFNSILKKYKMNEGLLKVKLYFLIDKGLTPADKFILEYVLKTLNNIKYHIIFEEDLIKEKSAIIMWDDALNIVNKKRIIHIQNIVEHKKLFKNKEWILIGISHNFELNRETLTKELGINILEYENSDTILFERVK